MEFQCPMSGRVRDTEESGVANVWVWGEHDTIHMYW